MGEHRERCVLCLSGVGGGWCKGPSAPPPCRRPPRRVTFALGLICILAPCAGMLLLLLLPLRLLLLLLLQLLLLAGSPSFNKKKSFSLLLQLVSFPPPFSYPGCLLHPHTHPPLPFFSFWPCPLFSLPHRPVSLPLFVSFVNFSFLGFAPYYRRLESIENERNREQ